MNTETDTLEIEIDKVAFDNLEKPDRGYAIRASYLKAPHAGHALIEVFKDGEPIRKFLFPAYKIWNLAAHFHDIVEGEIAGDLSGYEMASWDGISGTVIARNPNVYPPEKP